MQSFDLTGMRCPLPLVELNKIVKLLTTGDEFEVAADDPAFALDLPAWCRRTGHEVLSQNAVAGLIRAVVRVQHAPAGQLP